MSSIGAISSVGASSAAGGAQAAGAGGGIGNANEAFPAGNSGTSKPTGNGGLGPNRGITSNMSTRDFVTLAQKASGGGNMKDIKEMIKVMLALQILEETMEAVGEIIDNFITNE